MVVKAAVEAMGGKQNGSPSSFNFDGVTLLRNIALVIGIVVAGALWISKFVNAPSQIAELDLRVKKIEDTTIRTDEGIKNINEKVTALSAAVNTLIVRTYDKN